MFRFIIHTISANVLHAAIPTHILGHVFLDLLGYEDV